MFKKLSAADIVSVIISGLLLAMVYTHSATFLYVALGCSLLFILKPDVIFPGFFMASLSTTFFSLGNGTSAGRYFTIVMLLSLIISCMKNNTDRKGNNWIPYWITIVVATFFSCLVSYTGSFEPFIQMLLVISICALLLMSNCIDIERMFARLAVSAAMTIGLVTYQSFVDASFLFSERYNLDDDMNSNRVGMLMEQCSALIFASFFYYKNKLVKLSSIALIIISVFIILATGSRSSLIALLGGGIACSFFVFKNNRKKIFLPILIFFIIGYGFVEFVSSQDLYVLNRFSLEAVEENGGTGRLNNMTIIMTQIFPQHWAFGSGIGTSNMMALGRSFGLPRVSHNIIIDPLSQLGVFLYIIFMIVVVKIYKTTIKCANQSNNYIYLFPAALLFAATANGVGELIFFEKFYWLNLALCLMACKSLSSYEQV